MLLSLLVVEGVYHNARTQFRFEPRGLRGHDVARVGDVDELFHRDGVECEGHLHLAAVDTTLEFAQTADAAHEVYTLRRAQILDTEDTVQNQIRQHGDIKHPMGSLSSYVPGLAVRLYHSPSRYIEKLCSPEGL